MCLKLPSECVLSWWRFDTRLPEFWLLCSGFVVFIRFVAFGFLVLVLRVVCFLDCVLLGFWWFGSLIPWL